MPKKRTTEGFIKKDWENYLPSVSIDHVIFGFDDNKLKVLLLQVKGMEKWVLPGGFILRNEELDTAAARILNTRTGLKTPYLQQFHVFGSTKRQNTNTLRDILKQGGFAIPDESWLMQRFITLGYYVLVDYNKVSPQPDAFSSQCAWHSLDELPVLLFDHKEIVAKALHALRLVLNYQPIGYNLLPKEFTLKNLQVIYETILGKKLDRSNFNRKILSYGILQKKEKQFSGGAHKAPFLYTFDKEAYFKALQVGLKSDF
ncbi:MAG TPA: NUDIX domain-containing protein [Chitinophagaceae bacterium]|nr:NUDIX domain-containing protein [Chitinophagaceae bacterium]